MFPDSLLECTLSQLATWIQDLAPQAEVDITLEQYEDEDAHLYVHPPQAMTAEDSSVWNSRWGSAAMKFCWTRAYLLSVRCPIDSVEEERSTRGRCALRPSLRHRERGCLSILTIRGAGPH